MSGDVDIPVNNLCKTIIGENNFALAA